MKSKIIQYVMFTVLFVTAFAENIYAAEQAPKGSVFDNPFLTVIIVFGAVYLLNIAIRYLTKK